MNRRPFLPRVLALVTVVVLLASAFPAPANDTLVGQGSVWKYLDDGTDQGTAWRASGFADGAWASGGAQLGYGDGDEGTVVSYGPNASAKYITTYFRKTFSVSSPADYTSLSLRLLRDDGAVVYINGTEVHRANMPAGAVSYTTPATTALGTPDEATFFTTSLPTSSLVAGTNTIAVEIHQANGTSTDLSFDLELTGLTGAAVTRGPYLQLGTQTAMTVRWRTDAAVDSRVRYGTDPGNLDLVADEPSVTTEHEVRLTGLAPDTKYYYSVGTLTATLAASSDQFFTTSPASGKPTRIWVIGDAGTGTTAQAQVRNSYEAFTGTRATDLWLQLGDNAYENGTDPEFQTKVFQVYSKLLKQSVTWPAVGNHDTAQSSVFDPTIPYYQIFNLPTQAEAGGVVSGTEAYYSFDYGDIHFVCLDSMTSNRSSTGPMATWLEADLAATTKQWLVAYWHHPPYSRGSHNSDTDTVMTQMRQNIVPILEDNGVDLVMTGHSHSYERSFLIDSHYGTSATWNAGTMAKDGGSGREGDTGAYEKGTDLAPHQGAVYAVAGASGKISGGTLDHPAMYISLNQLGSMVIDVDGGRMDVRYLRETTTVGVPGAVTDSFTILKSAAPNVPPSVSISSPAAGASYTAPASITVSANASDTDGTVAKVDFFANGSPIGTDTTSPFGITWSNVAAGGYTLTATATDDDGAATTSAGVAITVNPGAQLPAAPSGLVTTVLSSTSIRLAWTDNATNETGFFVERAKSNGAFTQIGTTGANVATFTSTGLAKNTSYRFRVRATNASGSSAYSNIATAKTLRR